MTNKIILGCILMVWMFCLKVGVLLAKNSGLSVIMSELCFYPKQGENQWIELKNISDGAVDVSGWRVANGKISFPLPEGITLKPGEHVLVMFDGKDAVEYKRGCYIVHTPKDFKRAFLGGSVFGECALYDSKGHIKAFVVWGHHRSNSKMVKDAVKAGLWRYEKDFVLVEHWPGGIKGPIKDIQKGGSIGLYNYSKVACSNPNQWAVYDPDEVTPGGENPLARPGLHIPPNRSHIAEIYDRYNNKTSVLSFSCGKVPGADKYYFQLCRDEDCKDVIEEKVEDYVCSRVKLKGEGIYYWRVRAIDSKTGKKSPWSRVNKLIYGFVSRRSK